MKYRILVPRLIKNSYIFNNNCIQIMKHHKNEYEVCHSEDFLIRKIPENGDFIFDFENVPYESDVVYFIGNSVALINKKGNVSYFHTMKIEEVESK